MAKCCDNIHITCASNTYKSHFRSNLLLETLIWEEKISTTGWWVTSARSSRGSTRRIWKKTRDLWGDWGPLVSEQSEPSHHPPRPPLKLMPSTKVLTSTQPWPDPDSRNWTEIFSDKLLSVSRKPSVIPSWRRTRLMRLYWLEVPLVSPRSRNSSRDSSRIRSVYFLYTFFTLYISG